MSGFAVTVPALLDAAAAAHGSRVAVRDRGVERSYAELARSARSLAAHLRAGGLAPGERVAILEPNSGAFLEAYFGVAAAGAILCPLDPRLAPRELAAILADAGARHLIANVALRGHVDAVRAAGAPDGALENVLWIDGPFLPELDAAGRFEPVAVPPDRPAQLYFTSGTTGRSKGVVLTHRNVCSHAAGAVRELGLTRDDVWAHAAPMFHLADAWAVFALTAVGGTHAMLPRFEARAALEHLARERVTLTNLIPTMLARVVQAAREEPRELPALRLVLSGGAPIAPELVRAVGEVLGCDYAQTYGLTETSPYLTLSLPRPGETEPESPAERLARRARTGRPFADVEVEVVDEAGRPVARDDREVGEVRARGATVSPGYWNRPDETAAAFRGGWLYTGDLATVDAHGSLRIVDRRKDVILTGGETVYSTEVEHALAEHPAVLEVAVHAAPDAEWGEVVCAAVVLRPGATADADGLRRFARERLAGFKVPKRLVFLDDLPRTGSGKIAKRVLRERARGAG